MRDALEICAGNLTEGLFTICRNLESGKEALKDTHVAIELYEHRLRMIVELLSYRLGVGDLGIDMAILQDQNTIGAKDEEDKHPVQDTLHGKRMMS